MYNQNVTVNIDTTVKTLQYQSSIFQMRMDKAPKDLDALRPSCICAAQALPTIGVPLQPMASESCHGRQGSVQSDIIVVNINVLCSLTDCE